jgi:hypothetical protein
MGRLFFVAKNCHRMRHDRHDTPNVGGCEIAAERLSGDGRALARDRLSTQLSKPSHGSRFDQSKLRLGQSHFGANPVLGQLVQIESEKNIPIPRRKAVQYRGRQPFPFIGDGTFPAGADGLPANFGRSLRWM